ncbi:MAG: hypothetical protein RSB04_11915 [Gordonibacter sp.]|uniref:hypothetical protein n=1 Tax=Gordonibacter sp. TaxID=1968902 RepID=UPI002FC645CE
MLGPLGGDKVWDESAVHAAAEKAQDLANAGEHAASEGGIWYGYRVSQNWDYVIGEPEFLARDMIDHYSQDKTISKMYVAYKEA